MAFPNRQTVVGLEVYLGFSLLHAAQLAALAWGSPSIKRALSWWESMTARWTAVVVFPTPPFVFTQAKIMASFFFYILSRAY
jgi:hypothetical protein